MGIINFGSHFGKNGPPDEDDKERARLDAKRLARLEKAAQRKRLKDAGAEER